MTPTWVSVTRYADLYDVSRPTVYKWIAADLLEVFHVGNIIRIKNVPPVNRRQSCQLPPIAAVCSSPH